MSIIIDRKFISQIGSRLERFTQKKDSLYNFRCPLCGDSKKNLRKARGFLYVRKGGFYYKCHNCGVGTTFSNLLKEIDITLHKQYTLERWKSGENSHSNYKKPEFKFDAPVFKQEDKLINQHSVNMNTLTESHEARQYFKHRGIENVGDFYYADSWVNYVSNTFPEEYPDIHKAVDHPRIIIPFYDKSKKLTHLQGRAIDDRPHNQRYITLRIDKTAPKIFGLHKINWKETIYVVEGPFDSLFLPNCIAMGGGDCELLSKIVKPEQAVVVMDNEPRNRDTIKRIGRYIDMGFPVCIWPDKLKEKDINDIFLSGLNSTKILKLININTHRGMKAKFVLRKWKKC